MAAATGKNGVLPFAAAWMHPGNLTPSEASQTKTQATRHHTHKGSTNDASGSVYKNQAQR